MSADVETKTTANKAGLIVPGAIAALCGGGAALAVAWADPFAGDASAHPTTAMAADDKSDGYGEKTGKSDKPRGEATAYALQPIVVSLAADNARRAPRLRVVVAIEGGPGIADTVGANRDRLRGALVAAAREVPPEWLAGPDGITVLRDAFLVQTRALLGEDAVAGVLITDYVIT